jgi:hypothetical protein
VGENAKDRTMDVGVACEPPHQLSYSPGGSKASGRIIVKMPRREVCIIDCIKMERINLKSQCWEEIYDGTTEIYKPVEACLGKRGRLLDHNRLNQMMITYRNV